MRRIHDAAVLQAIGAMEDELVQTARGLASRLAGEFERAEEKRLSNKDHKERQLRNIQAVAEESPSWAPVELFVRYQAARKEIYTPWAEEAIAVLGGLREKARAIAGDRGDQFANDVHMELVSRVLGYTVRWHVWDAKGRMS
ncbi:MAG: hypothetical protein Kow00123_18390 [Anaerolineales bacterium]